MAKLAGARAVTSARVDLQLHALVLAVSFRRLRVDRREVQRRGLGADAPQRVLLRRRQHLDLRADDAGKVLEAFAALGHRQVGLHHVDLRPGGGGGCADVLEVLAREVGREAADVADLPGRRRHAAGQEDEDGLRVGPGEVRQQSAKPLERGPRPGRGVAGRFAARGNAGDARERLANLGGGRRFGANHRVGHRHQRDPVARGHRLEELIDGLLGEALVAGTEGRVLDDEVEDASSGAAAAGRDVGAEWRRHRRRRRGGGGQRCVDALERFDRPRPAVQAHRDFLGLEVGGRLAVAVDGEKADLHRAVVSRRLRRECGRRI